MNAIVTSPSVTRNLSLDLLFAGQAQKEFFLNEALVVLDALIMGAVSASRNTPPLEPTSGDCYRITATASGDWAGHEDAIAIFVGCAWRFVQARDGQRIVDEETGSWLIFDTGWSIINAPPPPSGGSIVDNEARAALSELIVNLRSAGVLG